MMMMMILEYKFVILKIMTTGLTNCGCWLRDHRRALLWSRRGRVSVPCIVPHN